MKLTMWWVVVVLNMYTKFKDNNNSKHFEWEPDE